MVFDLKIFQIKVTSLYLSIICSFGYC